MEVPVKKIVKMCKVLDMMDSIERSITSAFIINHVREMDWESFFGELDNEHTESLKAFIERKFGCEIGGE